MKVTEQAQALRLDHNVRLGALKRGLKQLLPQRVQAELLLKEPAKLTFRKNHAFSFQVRNRSPEPTGVIGHTLARLPREVQVELSTQLSALVQGALTVHRFQGRQQLVQAKEQVLRLVHQNLARVRVCQGGRLLEREVLGIELLSALAHHAGLAQCCRPCCRTSIEFARHR